MSGGSDYDDRGNRDLSITKPKDEDALESYPGTDRAMNTADAYLIGDTMTGGYGK